MVGSMLNCGNPPAPFWSDCQDQAEAPMFKMSQESLSNLVQVNDRDSLQPFGALPGIMAALQTNAETGIRGDAGDLHRRHKAFGPNLYSEEQPFPAAVDGFYSLALKSLKDTTIILLLCCAVLSLVIGIKRNGPVEGLLDGAIIFSAISFVLYFRLICRFVNSRIRRRRLSNNLKLSCVVRHGKMLKVSDSEVVIRSNYYKNPSLFTGAKVKKGNCRMLVVSVGKNTERNQLMRSVSQINDNQESRLQISIDNTNSRLEKIWLSFTLFILVVQLFRCFLSNSDKCDDSHNTDTKGFKNTVEDLMNESAKLVKKQGIKASGLVAVLSILLFGLRDGLPLGIFVSFVYASNKMKSHGVIVRTLPACATIGLVTYNLH
ncbi:Calcium-transporting ATPase 12 [Abeliophyllum distichum]|uniref:Calcium-transporting ATPase 12 n=1 Tax=Abeliophyllum distichum TaxID=126358 RepID=A0ABD1UFN8_9LAMI